MALRQHIHIILNPVAGARKRGLLDRVIEHLKNSGADVTLEETREAGHATALAHEAALRGRADVIVAAGGDGTINEVARGLLGQGVPLGIIPLGTANVLAIEIGLKLRACRIARMLLSGPAQLIGTGLVDGRLFLLMAGIGFDGEIVHAINPRLKRLCGKCAFVWAGLSLWLRGPARDVRLTADGHGKACAWAIVTNARYFAGPFVLAPEASLSQPGLTLFLFPGRSRLDFTRYLIAIALGRVTRLRDVEVLPARCVEFLTPQGLAVQVDGDARGVLPQVIEQGRQMLRLVLPVR